jgi:Ala-tRNA(Pro) deacylase
MNVAKFLTDQHVRFEQIEHPAAYTALRLAESVHEKGCNVAKTVLVRTNDGFAIAILPSTHRIDFKKLGGLIGARGVRLATEEEAELLFPDMEAGVVPPFGKEYGIRTVVDIHLAGCKTIVFEGGTHAEAIRMRYEDFEMLEMPIKGMIADRIAD